MQGRNSWRDSQANSTKCVFCCDKINRPRSGLAHLVWIKSSLSEKSAGAGHRACAGWVGGGSSGEPKGVKWLYLLISVWSLYAWQVHRTSKGTQSCIFYLCWTSMLWLRAGTGALFCSPDLGSCCWRQLPFLLPVCLCLEVNYWKCFLPFLQ